MLSSMGKVKVVLNSSGVRELLQSDEIKQVCEEQAKNVVQRAGDGFVYDSMKGKNRVVTMVKTDTVAAYRSTLKNNTLLKAL